MMVIIERSFFPLEIVFTDYHILLTWPSIKAGADRQSPGVVLPRRKSTVMQRVAEKLRAEESDPSVMPVIVIRANQEDVGASARLDYYRQILNNCNGMWECAIG
jgi:hypothetical protein